MRHPASSGRGCRLRQRTPRGAAHSGYHCRRQKAVQPGAAVGRRCARESDGRPPFARHTKSVTSWVARDTLKHAPRSVAKQPSCHGGSRGLLVRCFRRVERVDFARGAFGLAPKPWTPQLCSQSIQLPACLSSGGAGLTIVGMQSLIVVPIVKKSRKGELGVVGRRASCVSQAPRIRGSRRSSRRRRCRNSSPSRSHSDAHLRPSAPPSRNERGTLRRDPCGRPAPGEGGVQLSLDAAPRPPSPRRGHRQRSSPPDGERRGPARRRGRRSRSGSAGRWCRRPRPRFGLAAQKFRFTRFGGVGRPWLESVVETNRRRGPRNKALRPHRRGDRLTAHRFTPARAGTARTLGAPYRSRFSLKTAATATSRFLARATLGGSPRPRRA
jgi:hypothetical protein